MVRCGSLVVFPRLTSDPGAEGAGRGRSQRPSCDAEFARALKVFYHNMTSVRSQLQRLRRHRTSVRITIYHLHPVPPIIRQVSDQQCHASGCILG